MSRLLCWLFGHRPAQPHYSLDHYALHGALFVDCCPRCRTLSKGQQS